MDISEFSKQRIIQDLGLPLTMAYDAFHHVPPVSSSSQGQPIVRNGSTSLGHLSRLPIELMHMICKRLDVLSLSALMSISSHARVLVNSIPGYTQLMDSIGNIMPILKKMEILPYHPLQVLLDLLHKDRCVSCGHYGPFAILTTCQRYCYLCLCKDPMLSTVEADTAGALFKFEGVDLEMLPKVKVTTRSEREKFDLRNGSDIGNPFYYTSLKSIKDLAERLSRPMLSHKEHIAEEMRYREEKDMKPVLSSLSLAGHSQIHTANHQNKFPWSLIKHIQEIIIEHDEQEQTGTYFNTLQQRHWGKGWISFPSIVDGVLQTGFCCRGCIYNDLPVHVRDVSVQQLLYYEKLCRQPDFRPQGLKVRAWSDGDLFDHAERCSGATEVIMRSWKTARERLLEHKSKLGRCSDASQATTS